MFIINWEYLLHLWDCPQGANAILDFILSAKAFEHKNKIHLFKFRNQIFSLFLVVNHIIPDAIFLIIINISLEFRQLLILGVKLPDNGRFIQVYT